MRIFTLVASESDARCANLLLASLRAFGGDAGGSSVRVFVPNGDGPRGVPRLDNKTLGALVKPPLSASVVSLHDESGPAGFPFERKVEACARAERESLDDGEEMVWLAPSCLVVRTPGLLKLESPLRAALRVVHISNVGSRAEDSLDDYWSTIYDAVGLAEAPFTVESLVDDVRLRPYFNTHLFSIDPRLGMMAEWRDVFVELAGDRTFQETACSDVTRKIFLHQAVLCAIVARTLRREEIRELPPEYSYPLHFQADVPRPIRAERLEDLVCPVYEGNFEYPETLSGLAVGRPLRKWFSDWSALN